MDIKVKMEGSTATSSFRFHKRRMGEKSRVLFEIYDV